MRANHPGLRPTLLGKEGKVATSPAAGLVCVRDSNGALCGLASPDTKAGMNSPTRSPTPIAPSCSIVSGAEGHALRILIYRIIVR
jgi:hypothetical protein